MESIVDLTNWSVKIHFFCIRSTEIVYSVNSQISKNLMEKGIKSFMIIELKADCYLPGGMPLANVNGKGGIAINEATAKAPPAIATGAAKRLRTSGTSEQECMLQDLCDVSF